MLARAQAIMEDGCDTVPGKPDETELQGGSLSSGVTRAGGMVHRPVGEWTPTIHALLRHLEAAGFGGAPKVLGFDERGWEVLEYLEGDVPWPEAHKRLLGTDEAMFGVGQLLREFHEAVAEFDPGDRAVWRFPEMQADSMAYAGGRAVIVCHNDPAAWNLVVGHERLYLIDWDAAGPRPAIWDLAYCAAGVVPLRPDPVPYGWAEPVPVVERLLALAEGYHLPRAELVKLPEVVVARVGSSYEHGRRRAEAGMAPWDEMWRTGHGEVWAATVAHCRKNAARWSSALARRSRV
jgi:hypothetical protein